MTRKDYRLIAAALKSANATIQNASVWDDPMSIVIDEVRKALARDNPAFNPERFIRACELEAAQ